VVTVTERSEPTVPTGGSGRAGRDLPVAIGIGLGLGALVLTSLYLYKPVFLAIVVVALGIGCWELTRALQAKQFSVPFLPLVAGTTAVLCTAYVYGRPEMTDSLLLTMPLLLVWRVVRGIDGLVADLGTSMLSLLYLGLLAGFCALMLAAHDGDDRVATFVATVVGSDVGGYVAGVLFGKHAMAPRISPKKSWEGAVGSAVFCSVVGLILGITLLSMYWWQGLLLGLALVVSATLGDLGASMAKRDLGIKDWGGLLPGHGGILDRLDSLLSSAPVAWAILAAFVPVH
jgi:phosphatidate cytidylyltransferase